MTTEEARQRLNACKGHYPTIASESGLSYSWVLKFADGTIKDPGNKKIQALAAHPMIAAVALPKQRRRHV